MILRENELPDDSGDAVRVNDLLLCKRGRGLILAQFTCPHSKNTFRVNLRGGPYFIAHKHGCI